MTLPNTIEVPMDKAITNNAERVEHAILSMRNLHDCEESLRVLIENKASTFQLLLGIDHAPDTHQLISFVQLYIERCGVLISAFEYTAEITAVDAYTQPYLRAAADFFFEQNPAIDNLWGAHAFLYRAYLCHRMLEELNDRILTERHWPLAPIDLSHINLIMHTLIGDEDANLLDQTLLIRIELIANALNDETKAIFQQPTAQKLLAHLCKQGWKSTIEQWPCLGEDIVENCINKL